MPPSNTASGLPVPPGAGNVPKPAGAAGNLTVLDWAGFEGAVTYTYDDAQPSQAAHYAELQATGVRMTFFVSANVNWIPDGDAFWTQAVKDGHELGNHTASHPYANLAGSCFGSALGSLDAEIDACTNYIKMHYGQPEVWTMASPYGDGGYREAAQARFFLNRGVGGPMIGPNDGTDPFYLPCYMANAGDTAAAFNRLIDRARDENSWLILLFHTIAPTSDNWFAPVDINEIVNSINHAKGLGGVWIDTVANVGAYWAGQRLFASLKPAASGADKVWRWTLPAHFPKGKYLRVRVDGGTLRQGDKALPWDPHGYYEVSLDAGTLTLAP